MTAKVLEFRTVLGYIPSPYFKSDVYYARFSSRETIKRLNKMLEVFDSTWHWTQAFGRKLDDEHTIPIELMNRKTPITLHTIKELKADWNKSLKHNEPDDARFELLDTFLYLHGLSKLEMKKHYLDLERSLKEGLSPN